MKATEQEKKILNVSKDYRNLAWLLINDKGNNFSPSPSPSPSCPSVPRHVTAGNAAWL